MNYAGRLKNFHEIWRGQAILRPAEKNRLPYFKSFLISDGGKNLDNFFIRFLEIRWIECKFLHVVDEAEAVAVAAGVVGVADEGVAADNNYYNKFFKPQFVKC